jgi:hypothetical protein
MTTTTAPRLDRRLTSSSGSETDEATPRSGEWAMRTTTQTAPTAGPHARATAMTSDDSPADIDAGQPTGQAIDRGTTLAPPSVDRSGRQNGDTEPAAAQPGRDYAYPRHTGDGGTNPQDIEPAEPRRRRALARSGR